jgi:hypothetical protein
MSRLIIDTFEQPVANDSRSSVWIAVASHANESAEDAGIGRASSESLAASQAITHYFTRRKVLADAREAIKVAGQATPVPIAVTQTPPAGGAWSVGLPVSFGKQVAVSQRPIRNMLQDAIDEDEAVRISGSKVNGDSFSRRTIYPFKITAMSDSNPREVVRCHVPEDLGERTFYIDLLDRVERA